MRNKTPLHRSMQIGRYTCVLTVVWIIVIAASFFWNLKQLDRITYELARTRARTHIERDLIYRKWNAAHGGVYVWATADSPPNSYLAVRDRDIVSPSGKILTLINPAYMNRQIYNLAGSERHLNGHLTSLHPINPMNVPDAWEKRALERFQDGQEELSELEMQEDGFHLRVMRPFIAEKECLGCHKRESLGEVRGGMSVSIPMEPYLALKEHSLVVLFLAHLSIALVGSCGIWLGHTKLKKNISRRLQTEAALAESKEELNSVPAKLIQAQEKERKRLASELHDSIGQTLAALKYGVETVLCARAKGNADGAMDLLEKFVPTLQRSIDETRSIYMGLRPTLLADMGLLATIRWFLQDFDKLYPQHHVELEVDIEEEDIPKPLKIVVFRIIQEALNNVAKHSKAEWVDLSLVRRGTDIRLVIADDGIGMDLSSIHSSAYAKTLGLMGMMERAEITGGSFSIDSSSGEGTTVSVVWPKHST